MTWPKAEGQCQCHDGSHLASIHSDNETNFIGNLAIQLGTKLWFGITNEGNGTSNWSDGSSVIFKNWEGSVDGNGCGMMKNAFSGVWLLEDCDETEKSICKISEYSPSKKDYCLSFDLSSSFLFDANVDSCLDLSNEMNENLLPTFNIHSNCIDKCLTEVHLAVTIKNSDSCKNIHIFRKNQYKCGKPYWSRCYEVTDSPNTASQCEIICDCHPAMANCTLSILPSPFFDNRKICEIDLL